MLIIVNAISLCLLLTACAGGSNKDFQKSMSDIQCANNPSFCSGVQPRKPTPPDYQCTQNGPFINCNAI